MIVVVYQAPTPTHICPHFSPFFFTPPFFQRIFLHRFFFEAQLTIFSADFFAQIFFRSPVDHFFRGFFCTDFFQGDFFATYTPLIIHFYWTKVPNSAFKPFFCPQNTPISPPFSRKHPKKGLFLHRKCRIRGLLLGLNAL